MRTDTKKPEPDREKVVKERNCLMCRCEFLSQHIGEWVCEKCKGTVAWKSGAAA